MSKLSLRGRSFVLVFIDKIFDIYLRWSMDVWDWCEGILWCNLLINRECIWYFKYFLIDYDLCMIDFFVMLYIYIEGWISLI